jgi:hypothetical protein
MSTLSGFARARLLIAFAAADVSRQIWSGRPLPQQDAVMARQREQPQDEACA